MPLYDRRRETGLDKDYIALLFFELGKRGGFDVENHEFWRMLFNGGEIPSEAPGYIKKAKSQVDFANLTEEEREMAARQEMEQAARESEMHTAHELGVELGIELGMEQGLEQGMEREKMRSLAVVVRDLGIGLLQAMGMFGVSPEKRAEAEIMLREMGIKYKE